MLCLDSSFVVLLEECLQLTMFDVESKLKAYRFAGYTAFAFSAIAVVSVCITLPMVYNYVLNIRAQMDEEIEFCNVRFCNTY